MMALSMAFWSAARLLDGCFFCSVRQECVLNARFLAYNKAHLWLLALLEELLLSLLLVGLLPSKVLLRGNLVNLRLVDTSQINLLGCGDHVAGVNSSKWYTVDLEGAGDQEDTLWKVLQEDDALAAETTSKEDEHGAGSQAWSRSVGSNGLANLENSVSI